MRLFRIPAALCLGALALSGCGPQTVAGGAAAPAAPVAEAAPDAPRAAPEGVLPRLRTHPLSPDATGDPARNDALAARLRARAAAMSPALNRPEIAFAAHSAAQLDFDSALARRDGDALRAADAAMRAAEREMAAIPDGYRAADPRGGLPWAGNGPAITAALGLRSALRRYAAVALLDRAQEEAARAALIAAAGRVAGAAAAPVDRGGAWRVAVSALAGVQLRDWSAEREAEQEEMLRRAEAAFAAAGTPFARQELANTRLTRALMLSERAARARSPAALAEARLALAAVPKADLAPDGQAVRDVALARTMLQEAGASPGRATLREAEALTAAAMTRAEALSPLLLIQALQIRGVAVSARAIEERDAALLAKALAALNRALEVADPKDPQLAAMRPQLRYQLGRAYGVKADLSRGLDGIADVSSLPLSAWHCAAAAEAQAAPGREAQRMRARWCEAKGRMRLATEGGEHAQVPLARAAAEEVRRLARGRDDALAQEADAMLDLLRMMGTGGTPPPGLSLSRSRRT
ncbi:hypothetical protein ACQ5SO_04205 [Rhodovulum sp. DZ06]|uniref:hypothetical protein n=1 Tax=Rhodovulum sp. DZ06 TaxID=3425126 RepID=UPI003D35192F